ncbi:MAG: hypothetical protein RIN55_05565 [Tissierellaceae bacterium]|nr:hypothetical protein [Tissierellaceae bacterium]
MKSFENKYEARAWDLYVSRYANMTQETFMTFDEFYSPGQININKNKSDEEILLDVKKIIENFNGGTNNEIYNEDDK